MSVVDAIIDDLGITPAHEPVREGRAMRVLGVDEECERDVLLYVWDSDVICRRVVRALTHDQMHHQLFVIPDLLGADVTQRWTMQAAPEGLPLDQWMEAQGIAGWSEVDAARGRSLMGSLGTMLRKVHSLEGPGIFGELPDPDDASPCDAPDTWHTFNGWVARRLELYAEALDGGALPERMDLKSSLGDLRHELSAFHPRHPSVLVHGSVHPAHVWVDEGAHEVVALTGFDHAAFLPAEADLAKILWLEGVVREDTFVRSFYKGYGAARTMDVQRRERFYRRLAAFEMLLSEEYARLPQNHSTLVALTGPFVSGADLS